MRRPINWFVVLLSIGILFATSALPGCSSGSADRDPGGENTPPAATGMLRQVRSAAELETVLKSALSAVVSAGIPSGPIALPGAGTTADFSGTYTVEAGVDELDYVRYDGAHLFVAPLNSLSSQPGAIRILRTDPLSATAAPVGSIPVAPTQQIVGMYVANGRLLLVTTEAYLGPFGQNWLTTLIWAPTKFSVHVHDVRDPAQPRELLSATIDGVFVASRRVGDRVVLVSRHAPDVLLDSAQRSRMEQLTLADLLPGITIDGRTGSLVEPGNCYITNDGGNDGHAVLTTISTLSLASPHEIDGVCYDEPANGVYASQDALYLSEPRYETAAQRTRIHKFSLQGPRANYTGSVEVPGALWMGGQSDFRMNESGGLLRVFTTEYSQDLTDGLDHRLFVLRQKADEPALEIVGRLPSDARPAEIGKPGEDLYGVRFAGDRAYAVTFQRVDPLYVIDLSAPADPRIAGELLLPGFSDFLHPVTENLLLGLGSDGARFKLELYDTSELQLPQSRGVITLGDTASQSPALHDRHAFAYLAAADSDRLAVPATIQSIQPDQTRLSITSLHQFEIAGKQSAVSAMLLGAGEVSPPPPPTDATGVSRAFIDGSAVYYVENGRVWGSHWATPAQFNGPF